MARQDRKKKDAEVPEAPEETQVAEEVEEETAGAEDPEPEGAEPQAELKMKGGAAAVISGLRRGLRKGAPAVVGAPEDSARRPKSPLAKLLADGANVVNVRRTRPTRWDGEDCTGEVLRVECPITMQDLEREIQGECGGGRYKILILDAEGHDTLGYHVLDLNGAPLITPKAGAVDAMRSTTLDRDPAGSEDLSPEEKQARAIELENAIVQQNITLERSKQGLAELRRSAQGDSGKVDAAAQARELELIRQNLTKDNELKLAQAKAEFDRQIAELQKAAAAPKTDPFASLTPIITAALARPEPDPNKGMEPLLAMMMKTMDTNAEAAKESNRRFEAMMEAMRTDRIAKLERAFEDGPRKAANANITDEFDKIERIMKFAQRLQNPGEDEEDDEPKSVVERLVDDYIPRALKIFENLSTLSKGGSMTPEDAERKFQAAAAQAAAAAVENMHPQLVAAQRLPALPRPPQALPAPVQALPAPMPPPAPVVATPLPVSVPDVVPEPAPSTPVTVDVAGHPVAEPAPVAPPPTIADAAQVAIVERLVEFISTLTTEAAIGSATYEWPILGWQRLPREFRRRACEAADVAALISVFEGVATPEILAQLRATANDPEGAAWFKAGHDELKDWWAQLREDPQFDPNDEEDEAEDK